ncbi:MAG: hypothetical protein JSV53_09650 [candidate division WOR-3 bacterium]|nr:MAG: hypothetical protein JSV53_09650 [candidate division WOR-3 bacterium]
MKTIAILLAVLFVFQLCSKKDELAAIREGDFSIVTRDAYRGHLLFLGDGKEYRETVDYLRGVVKKNFEVLDVISEKFYTMPHLGYKFKYAALDTENGVMMLRYFARIREHPVYAGYQIQFLFDGDTRVLKGVYTVEVPLE